MTQTEALYYIQPPVGEFTARVLSCTQEGEAWAVTLDRTAFYPEGGGQPADRGTLGGADVLDVHEKGGQVVHRLFAPLTEGETVTGNVDLDRRLEMSQQHTGEHILSGTLHAMFGAENVGFHIGQDYLTMDTSVPISDEGLAEAEARANRVIWQNVPVEAVWHTKEELADLTYRSKKELEGPVRIVTVPGADCCACCGTHVERTGQVGMVKIIDWQNYKSGVRLFVVCGVRALRYFEAQRAEAATIRATLSAKAGQLAEAVQRQSSELEAARYRSVQAENELFAVLAEGVQPGEAAILLRPNLSPDGLRRLCAALSERTTGLCAAFSPTGNGTLAYALACTAPGADLRGLCKQLNQAFAGRGGGKPGFVQGSLTGEFDTVQAFLRDAIQP